MSYTSYFSKAFKDSISGKYSGIKRFIENKVRIIAEKPLSGEPLKGNLNGLRSTPVKGNFLIVYIICGECRKLKRDLQFKCSICGTTSNDSVVFIYFGPHDDTYKIAGKLIQRNKLYD